MFRNPTSDLIVVLVIVLLILGPKRLPALGRSLGSGFREFKDSITGSSDADADERPQITQDSADAAAGTVTAAEQRQAEPARTERAS